MFVIPNRVDRPASSRVAILPIAVAAWVSIGMLVASAVCGTQSSNPGAVPNDNAGNTKTFVNSKTGLTGKLDEHYVDFSFSYPVDWKLIPAIPGGPNFIKVERSITGQTKDDNFTQENFAVGPFWVDQPAAPAPGMLPLLAEQFSGRLAGGFPNYKQLSSEPATVAGYKAHELRFSSQMAGTPKGDITIWGRCVFIPDPAGGRDGVTLMMLATNLADGLTSDKDVGVKGELPVILSSFKLGK
jgi:hypothetical protein